MTAPAAPRRPFAAALGGPSAVAGIWLLAHADSTTLMTTALLVALAGAIVAYSVALLAGTVEEVPGGGVAVALAYVALWIVALQEDASTPDADSAADTISMTVLVVSTHLAAGFGMRWFALIVIASFGPLLGALLSRDPDALIVYVYVPGVAVLLALGWLLRRA